MATKRLTILNDAEIKFYYEPKVFALEEQQYYFTLDNHEKNIVDNIGSTTSKIYFILLLGLSGTRIIAQYEIRQFGKI